MMYGLAEYC